jgi:hypothetical protein
MKNVKTISGSLVVSAEVDMDGDLELELPKYGETIWLEEVEALELAKHISRLFSPEIGQSDEQPSKNMTTSNENQAASDLSASPGSAPIHPQPANGSDAKWAGAQVGGMTLRQHYAGLAMAAYIQADGEKQQYSDEVIASLSLKAADALILEQNVNQPNGSVISLSGEIPMSLDDYEKLKASGMMWKIYPEFTGNYEVDIHSENVEDNHAK